MVENVPQFIVLLHHLAITDHIAYRCGNFTHLMDEIHPEGASQWLCRAAVAADVGGVVSAIAACRASARHIDWFDTVTLRVLWGSLWATRQTLALYWSTQNTCTAASRTWIILVALDLPLATRLAAQSGFWR